MDYKPQLYPGKGKVAERRRQLQNPAVKLKRIREVSNDDVVLLLGYRKPEEGYSSLHPPLTEATEPQDPIRKLVKPTPGAKAGDRIRFIQIADTIHFPPIAPYVRTRMYMNRYRGVDTVSYSGRTLMEMRERDLEKTVKELMDSDAFDPARSGIRGITVHGSSLRLDTHGLMFDALRRYGVDANQEVFYTKDMMGRNLDRAVHLGKPADEKEMKERTVVYRADGASFGEEEEITKVATRIAELRLIGGANPDWVKGK